MLTETLKALSDPVRRQILEMLKKEAGMPDRSPPAFRSLTLPFPAISRS